MTLADGEFDWVGFTSVNARRGGGRSGPTPGAAPGRTGRHPVAAVGPATAASALRQQRPARRSDPRARRVGGRAGRDLAGRARPGESVLLPQSEIAGPLLADTLREQGLSGPAVTAYRTVPEPAGRQVAADLAAGGSSRRCC